MSDIASKPDHALMAALPPGETVLWQGRPRLTALAVRAFHVRKVALYFGLLTAWRMTEMLVDGEGVAAALAAALPLVLAATAAIGLLVLFAWLYARTTLYAVTGCRVVIRCGIALPMTLNIPFRTIGSAGLRTYADGSGDIPLSLAGADRVPFLMLWPHVRPWRLSAVEPMLRGVPDAAAVADILARALARATGGTAAAPLTEDRDERAPAGFAPPAAAAA